MADALTLTAALVKQNRRNQQQGLKTCPLTPPKAKSVLQVVAPLNHFWPVSDWRTGELKSFYWGMLKVLQAPAAKFSWTRTTPLPLYRSFLKKDDFKVNTANFAPLIALLPPLSAKETYSLEKEIELCFQKRPLAAQQQLIQLSLFTNNETLRQFIKKYQLEDKVSNMAIFSGETIPAYLKIALQQPDNSVFLLYLIQILHREKGQPAFVEQVTTQIAALDTIMTLKTGAFPKIERPERFYNQKDLLAVQITQEPTLVNEYCGLACHYLKNKLIAIGQQPIEEDFYALLVSTYLFSNYQVLLNKKQQPE